MNKPFGLDAVTLATELNKLPLLAATTATLLDPAHLAIARAVASGQSADELAQALSIPAGWAGLDIFKTPAPTASGVTDAPVPSSAHAATTSQTPIRAPIAPGVPVVPVRPVTPVTPIVPVVPVVPVAPVVPVVPVTPTVPIQPPAWAIDLIPILVKETTITRVVILDREPTALGGLETPAWARALSPSAVYGPVTATSTGVQLQTPKWIIVYSFTETVQIIRAGTVLCVLPLSIFHIGNPKQATVTAGSVWIAAHLFTNDAPAASFAGLTVASGVITCDQPIVINAAVVTLPATASVSLTLVPSATPAGTPGFPATVVAPGKITVNFPPAGAANIAFDQCSAKIYGEALESAPLPHPVALYNTQLKLLYIAGNSAETTLTPAPTTGKLLTITGSAPILTSGWALNVSESATPATLGAASSSGSFAVGFDKGLFCSWPGATKPEAQAGGSLIAQNNSLVFAAICGSSKGVLLKQNFNLWTDQDSENGLPCRILTGRAAGQGLLYATAGSAEVLQLGAGLEAVVDRPLLATGARVPAVFLEAILSLVHTASANSLTIYSALPAPITMGPNKTPVTYPLALDNAFLDVSQPAAILVIAKVDADFNVTEGLLFLVFIYRLVELFLPDPYAGALPSLSDIPGAVSISPTAGVGSVGAGALAAEVIWTAPDKVALRLADMAHQHPAGPPATEASSIAVQPPKLLSPPVVTQFPFPILNIDDPTVALAATAPQGTIDRASSSQPTTEAARVAPRQQAPKPRPVPLPPPPAGTTLLDVSTRASQLGVEVVTGQRYLNYYTIDGLSVRGPAALLPLTTLPAIAWEPMYNKTKPGSDVSVDNNTLLHPPDGDGPLTQLSSNSATLIPISPLQSLQSILDSGKGGIGANLTLPFGMIGALTTNTVNGTVLPNLSLVQPVFPAAATPTGSVYTGAWQLSITAPNPTQTDPVLAGRTYLRTQSDNPNPGLSYGEQVLGVDVAGIFSTRFNPANPAVPKSTGVPLRRYDLTGYGATTFSEWTNANPRPTDVLKAHFHVLIGRTAREIIQVQSIICPWAIKVVRTITIDRLASGAVERYDSGWQAASDGLFNFPHGTGITRDQIHSGLIDGVINVHNIQQVGLPITITGTEDFTGYTATGPTPPDERVPVAAPKPGVVPTQMVTFDADVIISGQHSVTQGASNQRDLNGVTHVCVPSKGITGYIGLAFDFHLSLADMAAFVPLNSGAGGPINAIINVGFADSLLRATEFDASAIHDTAVNSLAIVAAVRGIPKLSSDGSWSVAVRTAAQDAPIALGSNQATPLVQPNDGSAAGTAIHFANPEDIFRLADNSPNLPATAYGFLQTTATQSNFLSRPILTANNKTLKLGDSLNIAHVGALLGAISKFPGISNCLQFLGTELDTITNSTSAPSLGTIQKKQFKTAVRQNPLRLIDISIAHVDLCFHWLADTDLTKDVDPANVIIALGQPTSPAWELEVNRVAITLTIPALNDQPIIWLQGGFHIDSDTTPAFPKLDVELAGPLKPLSEFMTILKDIASVLSPGSGSNAIQAHGAHANDDSTSGSDAGLQVHFADGKLSVTDNFTLPDLPLGPGTISDVSLDIGATLDIVGLAIGFMISIGTMDAPCHWIVDPLSGTVAVGAGVKNNKMDIFILGGIGVGLAIDLGIASGSASIVLAVSVEVNGNLITIMVVLTGQAQVTVLGGLASASITLSAGLGLQFAIPPTDVNLIGTASVGIHISICWVINIDFSGSWTFQKDIPLHQLN
jgi:hypothetical protein